MTCRTFRLPDGGVAIVCSRGQRQRRCATPGCFGKVAAECDFPLSGKTCDRPMCAGCAVKVGVHPPGSPHAGDAIDYCRAHAAQPAQITLPIGGGKE